MYLDHKNASKVSLAFNESNENVKIVECDDILYLVEYDSNFKMVRYTKIIDVVKDSSEKDLNILCDYMELPQQYIRVNYFMKLGGIYQGEMFKTSISGYKIKDDKLYSIINMSGKEFFVYEMEKKSDFI